MPVAMVTNGCLEQEDYMKMGKMGPSSPPVEPARPSRHASRRRTFRRRLMRRQSHISDLVILHTQPDAVFDWARYIKSEVESRSRPNTSACLINSGGFIPEIQDNVRRTLSSANVALVIVSPDLITSLETISPYTFDFIPVETMAGAVLFFCGVEEGTFNLRKYFPSYDRWTKFKAHTDEEQLTPIFEHLAKLIGESGDSSPEEVRRVTVRRGHSDAEVYTRGKKVTHRHTPSAAASSWKPPVRHNQRRRATIKHAVQIFPDRGSCDQSTDVAAILSDDLLPCNTFEVECEGQYTCSISKLETTRLNNCTFQFTMPEGTCESARLRFVKDGEFVGSSLFTYESYLEDSEPVMQMLNSAIDGMCELLRTSDPQNYSSRIDHKLTQTLQRTDIPIKAFEQLFHHYTTSTKSERKESRLPTLLHLVAKYGLQEVTAMLVDLPGAKQAFSITNPEGQHPNDIARQHGHHELASFLEDYMGMVENEEMIYSSMKEYINQRKDGFEPLTEEELGSSVPPRRTPDIKNMPSDDYCKMDAAPSSQDDDIYLPMGTMINATLTHHTAHIPPPEPLARDIRLDDAVPGPGAQVVPPPGPQFLDDVDYMRMTPNKPVATRRPLPPTPRDMTDGPSTPVHRLRRSAGVDLGSKDQLDQNSECEVEEDEGEKREPEVELTEPAPDPSNEVISAPIVPFDDLLLPNADAPRHVVTASVSQAELLDIIYQVKQGEITVQDAECLVDGWKKQYNQKARWDKKSFKEKKESVRVLKESYHKTAEKVKEELQQPKKSGIKSFFNFRKKGPTNKGSKTPPPELPVWHGGESSGPDTSTTMRKIIADYQNVHRVHKDKHFSTKAYSEPAPASDPMVDMSRLQVLQQSYDEQDMSGDPVCQSIPELPPGLLMDDSKRFSTISTSSSSSTASCMSRTSYGSQQDSGIDVPIREESPALQGSNSSIYDKPQGPPRPVLPVPISKKNASSDECSGYEDVDHWLEPDGGSVRARTDSSTMSELTEESTSPVDKDPDEAPPVPPRSRCSSYSSITDALSHKPPVRRLLPPKAGRKSSLPQPRANKYPPISPKPRSSSNTSEGSGGEDQLSERRPSAIPGISVAAVIGGATSSRGCPSPRSQRPSGTPPNYSNVVLDLKNRQRKSSEVSVGRTPRGSTSDEGADLPPGHFAPPVPPRSPRD